jgi:hypothetical protein
MVIKATSHKDAKSTRTAKISTFEMTLEDAGRMGKCFESFDDSDSWPGGFTHGIPQTAEYILENFKKWNVLQRKVARLEDKTIIGYCNVMSNSRDEDAVYIAPLGINTSILGIEEWSEDPFRKESFSGKMTQDGSWYGVEFETRLKESPQTRDLEVTVSYMTVPEAPLVRISLSVFNPANRAIECRARINVFTALASGKTFHYWRNDFVEQHISSSIETPISPAENWVGIEFPERGQFLGVIQPPTLKERLHLHDGGEKFDNVGTNHIIRLAPQKTIVLDLYLLLAESIEQITNIARSFLT